MQLANFFALQPYVEVYLYILNNYTTMALNTYFKVILFEIFVFEYDFRCTRTRVRFGGTRTRTRTRRVGTRTRTRTRRVGTRTRTRTRGVGTRTRTRESPYLPSSVLRFAVIAIDHSIL